MNGKFYIGKVAGAIGDVCSYALFGSGKSKKPSLKEGATYRGIGRKRDVLPVAGLVFGVLGPIVAFPEWINDQAVRAVSKVIPKTADGSRIPISSSGSEEVGKAENEFSASILTLYQEIDKYLQDYPKLATSFFLDSEGAQEIKREFLRAYAEHAKKLHNSRQNLEAYNVTPQTILESQRDRDNFVQTKKREAFFNYVQSVEDAGQQCSRISERTNLPAKLKLSNDMYKVLAFWEENFDKIFQPVLNTPAGLETYKQCKNNFLSAMVKIHKLKVMLDRYGLTPEMMLAQNIDNEKIKPSPEEINELLETLGEESMQTPESMKMLLDSDAKFIAFIPYTTIVFNLFNSVTTINPKNLQKYKDYHQRRIQEHEEAIRTNKKGRMLYYEKAENEDFIQGHERLTAANAPFWQAFQRHPKLIPDEVKREMKLYNLLTAANLERIILNDLKNSESEFSSALSNASGEDLARVIFSGRMLNNRSNFRQKRDTMLMQGIYRIAEQIREEIRARVDRTISI